MRKLLSNPYALFAFAGLMFLIGTWFREPLPLNHKILVATEKVRGQIFEHSVIFVLHHGRFGAYGLILNDGQGRGGPVYADDRHLLTRAADAPSGAVRMDDVGLAYKKNPEQGDVPKKSWSLLLHGHAGWGPRQLDREVRQGGWRVIDYDDKLVTQTPRAGMWRLAANAAPSVIAP